MKRKEIIISSFGNIVEWLDFGLFIFMAPIIGAKFFPLANSSTSTLSAFAVFAAGFLCRPLGGIFFGYFGDTRGRTSSIRISIILITLTSLLIGLLPTYANMGYPATIIFILLRLIQGVSIGGEYSGIIIYLAESAPSNRRGLITSLAATGANFGFLLATFSLMILNFVFTKETIAEWAWRLPFIFVGFPGIIIIYYRFSLKETRVYSRLEKNHYLTPMPFITALKFAPKQLMKILGMTCMSSTFYYVFFGYMPGYLEKYLGFLLKDALIIQSCLLILMLFLVPLAGLCGDYLSRKKLLIITNTAVILLVLPCFYLLQMHSIVLLWISLSIATIISSLDQGASLIAAVENCPTNVRYSGIAFSYNLGMAIFGGTAPMITILLIENVSLVAPAYYLIFMAFISLITALTLVPSNRFIGPLVGR